MTASAAAQIAQLFSRKVGQNNAYDEVPYHSFAHPQTHPRRLATLARLRGLESPAVENCRVLELACSSGGNLLPMAEQLPAGRFLGIDSSQVAIADGQAVVDKLGLTNVELRRQDILDIGDDLGTFDYVIAHGIFSWASPQVRAKILEICARRLAPCGVACISYNTHPGWRFRGIMRDMLRYRTRACTTPSERLVHAHSLVNALTKCLPAQGNPYGQLLGGELRRIAQSPDYYLLHEYLEADNEPLYFHEFAEMANCQGLQYVGEADFSSLTASGLSPNAAELLGNLASDILQQEQFSDIVKNRMFRQTILCRRELALQRPSAADVHGVLHVASAAEPTAPVADLTSAEPVRFQRAQASVTTTSRMAKSLMLTLREHWPGFLAFDDLLRRARERLAAMGAGPSPDESRDTQASLEMLLHGCTNRLTDLTVSPWTTGGAAAARPLVSPLARHQALATGTPANRGHVPTPLNGLQAFVASLCDGVRDRAAIIDELYRQSSNDVILSDSAGQPITDANQIHVIFGVVLDEALRHLAAEGLLAPAE